MTQSQTPAFTLIIGGGLGGLICAAHLARAGRDVLVLEAREALGGRARTDREGGALLNLGAHAMYRAGPLKGALDAFGIKVPGGVPTRGQVVDSGGEHHALPASPASMMTTSLLRGRERPATAALLLQAVRGGRRARDDQSLAGWLDDRGAAGRPRQLLEALGRLTSYQASPGISASAVLGQLSMALRNVVYADGGWGAIVERLADLVEGLGVTVQTQAAVRKLERTQKGLVAVLADGRRLLAGHVVIATPKGRAVELLERSPGVVEVPLGPWATAPGVVVSALDVVLERQPSAVRFTLGFDAPLYASVHSKEHDADRGGADLGGPCVVHLIDYDPPSADASRARLEALLDRMQPGWRSLLRASRYLPRMEVSGHCVEARTGGFSGRAPVALSADVSLVGDWVGGRGLIADASAASAQAAAKALLERLSRRAAA